MAILATVDIIASFEAFLQANWPSESIKFVPTAAVAMEAAPVDDLKRWIALQWIDLPEIDSRATEDRRTLELRILCNSRHDDRLDAIEIADMFRELLRNVAFDITDRSDGTTKVGDVRIDEASVSSPQRDERGVAVCIVDVLGTAIAD